MRVQKLGNAIAVKPLLKQLGVDGGGVEILSAKAQMEYFYLYDLHVGAANILKQDALSVGADLAVPKGTVIAQTPQVDCVLIGSKRQLAKLAKKELAQPFGLKEVAKELQRHLNAPDAKRVKIMGVLNANSDSFYSKSRFLGHEAIEHIERMIEQGADIIDVGGVSSRPGASSVDAAEEMERVTPILETVVRQKLYEKVAFSIDSYTPSVVKKAMDCGFQIINDITGFKDDELCQICAQYGATAVVMHMQGTPQTMQNNPSYENVVLQIYDFFEKRIEKLEDFGVQDIVLDVGIGFGKTLHDNMQLLNNLEHFRSLQKDLLVGASRKSMIDAISSSAPHERLGGTLALHLHAVQNGADIVRVRDVYEHKQALDVFQKLRA